MSLKDFLKDFLGLGQDDVYKVDVKDSFSFFNTDEQHKNLVLQAFEDFKLEGRNVNVEISENSGGRGARGLGKRSFGSGDRSRGRSGGGSRGRSGARSSGGYKGGGYKSKRRDDSSGGNAGDRSKRRDSDARERSYTPKTGFSEGGNKSKFSGKRRGNLNQIPVELVAEEEDRINFFRKLNI